ncbi:MAG TPA: M20/M25/M40 family metallo-hydrolase [Allosphingosinicella sp.]|jgi:acetylornithine deacetylase/succinyl-diaminopimelate desuccinylase-like protein
MTLRLPRIAAFAFLAAASAAAVAQPAPSAGEAAFRATYKELVETNTTLSAGSCTLAAQRMAARLRAAGFPASDLHLIVEPSHPKEGGLVAILPGTDSSLKAILLLAHIDVVEANRADWERDPFTLVEEKGYFYARGASDDKAQAAVWVDTLVRFTQEGYKPKRTVKMALTCGEETAGAFNGAQYLATRERQLIDAEFALNEGAGGLLDEQGRHVVLNIQAGEKFPQNYRFEVTNPGGHSSRPVKENAIYRLADALVKLRAYDFPVLSNEATRGYFGAMAKLLPDAAAPAMAAFAANPNDAAAAATLAAADPAYNSILHTTCVATMLDGGHATNALPQRARANVNCRIFPGTSVEDVRRTLETVVGDPQVKVTILETRSDVAAPPPLTERIVGPVKAVAAQIFPGVPLVPLMAAGATDGAFLTPVGIPTYGLSGFFSDKEGSHAHGLNERMRVKSLMEGREFLYRLVKAYTAK